MTDGFENRLANDDERLSALIDGELDAADATVIEARLAAEPALARRLTALRQADSALRRVYGPIADEPSAAALAARLERAGRGGEARDAPGDTANVVPLRRSAGAGSYRMPASLAAGIALAIGIALGVAVGPRDDLTDTERLLASNAPISAERELFEVLESLPSGETAALAGNLSATPRLTFRTADGDFCRELALSSNARQTTIVGCRTDAVWAMAAVVQLAGPAGGSGQDGFVPASGPGMELDAFVNALMDGVALSASAEREAIASGWR
jgi:hypothetical protein